jgi:hypothetical protein
VERNGSQSGEYARGACFGFAFRMNQVIYECIECDNVRDECHESCSGS